MRRARARLLVALLLTFGLTGCAALQRPGQAPETPAQRLARASHAVEAGDFAAAFDQLTWVYTRCLHTRIGRRALLLLAATEIDPRNPARRPDIASALAAYYLLLPAAPAEEREIARSIFLLARELGGAEPRLPPLVADPGSAEVTRLPEGCQPVEPLRLVRIDSDEVPEGATEERIAAAALVLPALPVQPVPERVARVGAERDDMAGRVASLLDRIRRLEQEIQEQQEELERIRRTLRP